MHTNSFVVDREAFELYVLDKSMSDNRKYNWYRF